MNYSKDSIINELIQIGKRLGFKNYTPGYSGNLSARYNDSIIITTSGSSNGYLSKNDLVEMDFNAKSLEDGKKPSSEKFLHVEFYKKRPDINYIIHVHCAGLSAFAAANKDLMSPYMAENVFYFGGIPLADYALPSTMELVENTVKYFDKFDAVLMANHGFVVASKTIEDAYMKLELAESYAQVVLNTYLLGGAKYLTQNQAEEILALR